MTREELSLLLYLETRVVDHGGRVDTRHMNAEDVAIVERWSADGFCNWGRIASSDLTNPVQVGYGTHWCQFGEPAWQQAHEERRKRAQRMWGKRTWLTTDEKRRATK